jgi:hypothetical protein
LEIDGGSTFAFTLYTLFDFITIRITTRIRLRDIGIYYVDTGYCITAGRENGIRPQRPQPYTTIAPQAQQRPRPGYLSPTPYYYTLTKSGVLILRQ